MNTSLKEKKNTQTNPPATDRKPVYWVASTHWDREWYETFQGFRYRLISMLDEVLNLLDGERHFDRFQMDGQSIPIEDYLEVRPERAEQIRRLASSGRLAIGPWYVLPDEFLVSGESLVRNFQEGLRVARQWGQPSRAGFVCDIFGHTGQLPQILRGFGIDSAFVWRGINEDGIGSFFRWAAPDGSEVLTYRFGPQVGYCDFAFKIRHAHEAGKVMDPAEMAELFADYIRRQQARCAVEMPILLFDGGDHLEVEPAAGEIIASVRQGALSKDYDVRMGTLDEFIADCRRQDWSGLPVVQGELRQPATNFDRDGDQQWLIPGVLSSRMPLKQANARCESLLTQWAEPWSLFAACQGFEYPQMLLRIAWRHLLKNQAHDSICGCSIDQVHKDMEYRFDQARLIAERLRRAALEHLAGRLAKPAADLQAKPEDRIIILLANPTAQPIDEPVDITVRLPENSPKFQEFFGYEQKPGFWLTGADGERLPYQRIAQSTGRIHFNRRRGKFPQPSPLNEVEVAARVKIPAFGYTTLTVEPASGPTRHEDKGLARGPRQAENEWLALEIAPNGLLNLTDKRTGQRYEGLLELEDRADIGDGWYHGVAVNDRVYCSGAVSASVACLADGPERVDFLVELDWLLPARFEFDSMRRSSERSSLRVTHRITLRAGCARLEVRTHVANTITDHRLRVLLPSGAQAQDYLADAPFDVVRRPIALNPEHIGWRELEVETKPQRSWTSVSDGRRGLAVVAPGLPESAVLDQPARPLALTLFRSFVKTVFTNDEPGGQLQQELDFSYWIVPLAGEPDAAALSLLGQRLSAGLGQAELPLAAAPTPPSQNGHALAHPAALPPSQGFLEVSGAVVVTAVKAGEDGGTVLRLFNPGEQAASCHIGRPGGLAHAWRCDLEEQPLEPLPVAQGVLRVELPAKRIETYLFN